MRGWVPFLNMHLRDYLLTDNGEHLSRWCARRLRRQRIIGLAHLDSARCTRTADPMFRILHRDRLGKSTRCAGGKMLTFSDMPDPSETWNGVGLCAANRAF